MAHKAICQVWGREMSFHLRIDGIENRGNETCIRGRLIEGAYFGPQYIRLKDTTGNDRIAAIVSHGMTGALNWRFTADHDTQLELYIATPDPQFSIDPNSPRLNMRFCQKRGGNGGPVLAGAATGSTVSEIRRAPCRCCQKRSSDLLTYFFLK